MKYYFILLNFSQTLKRRITVCGLVLSTIAAPFANADYYVDSFAKTEGDGSKEKPFRTISEAAAILQPGETCFIRGGVYRETIRPKHSGTENNPIRFQQWKQTDKVVITGLNLISQNLWKPCGNNQFETPVLMGLGHENQVFYKERMLLPAGWPNQGDEPMVKTLSTMDEGSKIRKIVDDNMPDYNYEGASVWIHAPHYWSNWTAPVLSFSKNTLKIGDNAPFVGERRHVPVEGAEYYIFNIKEALDSDNEYFYDELNRKLSVYRSDGSSPDSDYAVKVRMHAFDLSGLQNIQIEGVHIFAATIQTDHNTENVDLDRLVVHYPYYSSRADSLDGTAQADKGLIILGKNINLMNSEVAYSSGSGVLLAGQNNKVLNSHIHDNCTIGTFASGIELGGTENVISHCTIRRTGRSLIGYPQMHKALIQYNILTEAGLLTSDLGLTYGNAMEAGNSEVRYNWMYGNRGKHMNMGLYYDHGTKNIITHHNVIWDVKKAAIMINHYAHFHLVYNNTFLAEENGFLSNWGNKYSPDLHGCRFMNNLFNRPPSTTAGNYFWGPNLYSTESLDGQKYPTPSFSGIDTGIPIHGITHDWVGNAPDMGAYEYGKPIWKAGHDFEKTPLYNFARSRPLHRNLIENSAFEHYDNLSPWYVKSGSARKIQGNQFQGKEDRNELRIGRHSIALRGGGEIAQEITELMPERWYEFSGHVRSERGEARAVLGVRYKNGSEVVSTFSPEIERSWGRWHRILLSFRTLSDCDSITVFIRNTVLDDSEVFIDDFGFVLDENEPAMVISKQR